MSNTQNTVSPETALRLKDAGFPQPEMKFGQVWADNGINLILTRITKTTIGFDYDGGYFDRAKRFGFNDLAYCPIIPDLLSELGEVTIRRIRTTDGYFYTVAKNVGDDTEITSDYELAEALALMWEKINNL